MIVNGVEMERVDFDSDAEWSELRLSDGTVLKVKVEVNGVLRAVDKWDERGEPLYQLSTPVQVAFVSVPKHLMRPEDIVTAKIGPEVLKGKAN